MWRSSSGPPIASANTPCSQLSALRVSWATVGKPAIRHRRAVAVPLRIQGVEERLANASTRAGPVSVRDFQAVQGQPRVRAAAPDVEDALTLAEHTKV